MRRKLSVFSIVGKIVSCILFFAVVWIVIRWFWLSYDWFPMMKSEISEIFIPIALSLFVLILVWHEIYSANDKWEGLVISLVTISSVVIMINAEYLVEDATMKVISVEKLTDLSREEIRNANYLHVEKIEPDTSLYNYTTDSYIRTQSRSSDKFVFCVYQVCPLKDMEGAFVCSVTKDDLGYIGQSYEKLQRWASEFENNTRGTIKVDAVNARFFKVIHQSDNIEKYMEAASYLYGISVSAKKDVVLLEISDDKVDGCWNNVVIILVTLVVLVVLLFLVYELTGGASLYEYDDSRRFSSEITHDVISYLLVHKGNVLVLLPPLLMIGWGLYMIFNGYNPVGSNHQLFDESGACTPASLLVDGEWWRIVTSMFIHRDFMHIFGNMMWYAFGAFLLCRYLYGRDIFLVFLISGALSIAFAVLYSESSVIGASGGVFGLYGAFMSLFIGESLSFKRRKRSDGAILWFFVALVILAINLVGSFRSDISMSGHISGFVCGAIVVWLFRLIYYFFNSSYREFCR